ncbi:glycosyltransferase [Candidatus Bathyarchaeota archaeon]|nr:glycosyltransferase [Candidatus Bathyarchaeota archaeon]
MAGKIGVFCPTLNNYGGGEYVAVAIANTLAENNHKVILFSNRKVDPKAIKDFYGETLYPSIETIEQPTVINSRGIASFYQTIFRSYIAKSKCDIFLDTYSNCIFPWTNISYIHFPTLNKYAYSKNFPYLASPHRVDVGILPHVIFEKNAVSYSGKLVLANSHYTAAEIKEYSGKNAEVLYPPFTSTIKTSSSNSKINLVVTTSRFEQNKMLERIPQIAAKTSKNVKFAVIGRLFNREILSNLQETVKKLGLIDRVKFYPDLPAQEKLELLSNAKIYLHTMVGEHFGISIVEAMASGCLPIVHNSGGMREFVPVKYRYETVQDAADKINSAINDWSPDKSFETKAIAENFSYANFSRRFMELFCKYYN